MDLEPVCEIAQKNIAKYGLEKQITTVARDMFKEAWPEEPDGVLFGNVFHYWDLEHCYLLARRAFDVLKSGGKVLLQEMPLHDTKDGGCYSSLFVSHITDV